MKDRGFSLVESLVACVLTLTVAGAVVAFVSPSTDVARAQPEAMDVQQRARTASDALSRDLLMAGAGVSEGPRAGALIKYFPPAIPRRLGLNGADPVNVARADTLTIVYVPPTPAQTTLSDLLEAGATDLRLDAGANCPIGHALCGLDEGMSVLVFDRAGFFDLFALRSVGAGAGVVQHLDRSTNRGYAAGSFASQVELHTYYFDSANRQLRHYDGAQTDFPVVDNVVSASFEYFGDPQPPTAPKPPAGVGNCLYDAAGNLVSVLPTLAVDEGTLARLPLTSFTDGPWCGEGGTMFDADLLRVRRVRVTLRLQAAPAALRGSGADYAVSGLSRRALASLPDYSVVFDVSPRNLNLGR
jgi:type II secretory pathway pseudopilin PulG